MVKIKALWRKIWYSSVAKETRKWIKRNIIFILIAFLLFIGGLAVWRMCDMSGMVHYLDRLLGTAQNTTNPASENVASSKYQTLRTLGLIIFGIGALIGLAVANRRAEAQFGANEKQSQANRDKIYNDAITHLGHKEASVRLGGAYALYELTELDPSRLKNIAEILCAHVREKTQDKVYKKGNTKRPSNEMQSILNLLSKLNEVHQKKKEKAETLLDLSRTYLNGANLEEANLQHANLQRAEMRRARLNRAQIQGANLNNAQMQGTRLNDAQMQGANLNRAQMQGARLDSALMQGTRLYRAQMQGADLSGTQMQGANLRGAQMQGADLHDTNMTGTFAIENKMHGLSFLPFKERINERRNKDAELKTVIWSGEKEVGDMGKIEETLKKLVKEEKLEQFIIEDIIQEISSHKGKKAKHKPIPKGVITGKLTDKMADEIIQNYEEAMKS